MRINVLSVHMQVTVALYVASKLSSSLSILSVLYLGALLQAAT